MKGPVWVRRSSVRGGGVGLTKIKVPFIFGILQVHRQTLLELLHPNQTLVRTKAANH